jgi:hypothetical protein
VALPILWIGLRANTVYAYATLVNSYASSTDICINTPNGLDTSIIGTTTGYSNGYGGLKFDYSATTTTNFYNNDFSDFSFATIYFGGVGGGSSGLNYFDIVPLCLSMDTNQVNGWYSVLFFYTADSGIPNPPRGNINYYAKWYWDKDTLTITPINPFSLSHFISFTYSTTTATANITGYWEATTTPYITQQLSFWQFSNTLGKEAQQTYTATTTGYFNFFFPFLDPYSFISSSTATTTAPIFDSFTLNASLDQYDETNYIFPYGGTIITNLDATSTTIFATQYNASDFISSPRALALYPEYECGITSLTGCFKNAIIWAFYPTQEALNKWTDLQITIETKAPVGYFYMAKNNINGLSATSTKAFNVVIPTSLKTYIFNPFDTGIAGILWLFFIFNFYKRLKTITI